MAKASSCPRPPLVRPLPATTKLMTSRKYLQLRHSVSQQSGLYPSKLLGNAGFAKLDVSLSSHNQLALRVSTSRYSGANNVFLDPSSPVTTYGISDNGIEHVATETATASLTSALSWRTVSH